MGDLEGKREIREKVAVCRVFGKKTGKCEPKPEERRHISRKICQRYRPMAFQYGFQGG